MDAFTSAADRLLADAAVRVRLLGAVTPVHAAAERERLTAALLRGEAVAPQWTYASVDHEGLLRSLDACEKRLARESGELSRAYVERARELSVEAEMAQAAGTPRLGALAQARYAPRDEDVARDAARLAHAWGAAPDEGPHERSPLVASDADDPRSLLSRMRAEVGRRLLPFSVVAHAALAPLSATGERTILVARGRMLADEDTRRTVLHEIEGHAMPRARARKATLGVFSFGTARGADDQEGRALLLEERAGFLAARRRRQLAARHRTVLRMLEGATFVDALRALTADGVPPRDAVLVAERAYRGGDGRSPGLGRERIYLECYVRVRRALLARPDDEEVMMGGQIAVSAIDALRDHAPNGG